MQDAEDDDFAVVVKFDSILDKNIDTVLQGIVIEEDAGKYVRFNFQSNGDDIVMFGASVNNNSMANATSLILDGNKPYMRVTRTGNSWRFQYSADGSTWLPTNSSTTFTFSMTANKAGIFAGNAGATTPAHTVLADYFYNSGSPGVGDLLSANSVTTNATPSNGGTVNVITTNFGCGDPVTVEAVPADGWEFEGWSGGVTGSDNPATFTFDVGTAVTAQFAAEEPTEITHLLYLPFVVR